MFFTPPPATWRFNTQPPEGGWKDFYRQNPAYNVSTHSRLKAAGKNLRQLWQVLRVSTHSRLKAAGGFGDALGIALKMFQHTAA